MDGNHKVIDFPTPQFEKIEGNSNLKITSSQEDTSYNEFDKLFQEAVKENLINIFPSMKVGENDMPTNEYDLFMKDIKDDLREREARNEKRYERIHEDMATQKLDIQKRDEQFRQEAKEREERYINDAKDREDRYQKDAKEREDRIMKAFEEAKQDMRDSKDFIKSSSDNLHSIMITNIWGWIATLLAIAAIVITFFLTNH